MRSPHLPKRHHRGSDKCGDPLLRMWSPMESLRSPRSGVVAHRPLGPMSDLFRFCWPFSSKIGVFGGFGGVFSRCWGVSGCFGRRVGVPGGLLGCWGACFGLSGRANSRQ